MLLKKGLIWMKPVRNSGSMDAMYSSMFTRCLLVLGTLGVAEAGLIFSDEDMDQVAADVFIEKCRLLGLEARFIPFIGKGRLCEV
jgi:hypothetical protein